MVNGGARPSDSPGDSRPEMPPASGISAAKAPRKPANRRIGAIFSGLFE